MAEHPNAMLLGGYEAFAKEDVATLAALFASRHFGSKEKEGASRCVS